MKGKKKCKRCGEIVTLDDKGVMLMTFQGNENLEKVYWHWKCYLDWLNESIGNKAAELVSKNIQPLIQSINGVAQ
jgi:hypothetical protein